MNSYWIQAETLCFLHVCFLFILKCCLRLYLLSSHPSDIFDDLFSNFTISYILSKTFYLENSLWILCCIYLIYSCYGTQHSIWHKQKLNISTWVRTGTSSEILDMVSDQDLLPFSLQIMPGSAFLSQFSYDPGPLTFTNAMVARGLGWPGVVFGPIKQY